MNWQALALSLELALWTIVVLLPVGIALARLFAWRRFPGKLNRTLFVVRRYYSWQA